MPRKCLYVNDTNRNRILIFLLTINLHSFLKEETQKYLGKNKSTINVC